MVVILRWIRTSVPTTYSYWPGLEEGLRLLQKCYYIQLLILHSPYIITTLSRVGTYCRYVCTLPLHVCTPYCTSKLIVNGTCGISWYHLHVCRCLIGPIIRARFQVLVIRRNRKWTRPISTLRALPGSLPITFDTQIPEQPEGYPFSTFSYVLLNRTPSAVQPYLHICVAKLSGVTWKRLINCLDSGEASQRQPNSLCIRSIPE